MDAVESFDLRYNLRFKIIGAEVGVGGVRSIESSDLSESESKLRNTPSIDTNRAAFYFRTELYDRLKKKIIITIRFCFEMYLKIK